MSWFTLYRYSLALALWMDPHFIIATALCPQVRALFRDKPVPGEPSFRRWTVKKCRSTEYAVVSDIGALSCAACPEGADCSEADATLKTLDAIPGWWVAPWPAMQRPTASSTRSFYQCPLRSSRSQSSCLSGNASTKCDSANGFSPGGHLCAHCRANYVRDGPGCSRCRATHLVVLGVILVCFMCSGFVSYKAHKALKMEDSTPFHIKRQKIIRAAVQRITISHVAMMSSVGGLTVRSTELFQVHT